MTITENEPLRDHTTFRIGGPAELFITVESADELPEAYAYAASRGLAVYPLGEGSNVLVSDDPISKAFVHLSAQDISYEKKGDQMIVRVSAGMSWDVLVRSTTAQGFWGLENLAGIPGTVGAAPVQNIGAYGREAKDTILSVEAYDPENNTFIMLSREECAFGYRDSRFKRAPGLFITSVTFALSEAPTPELSYPDLKARIADGMNLDTPERIANEVRAIRAQKFPDLSVYGTAGSFFKNPTVSKEHYAELSARYEGLPGYENANGIKIPLAWILDRVLGMRGFSHGPVSLFEKQPLVLVASKDALANDVHELARIVEARIKKETGITLEREVQTVL